MLVSKSSTRITAPHLRARTAVVRVICFTDDAQKNAQKKQHAPLIERLGGPTAIRAAVDVFYTKVLADERVNHYFRGTDMKQQRAHQAAFMTYAFGGANQYPGKDMVEAHKHLVPHLNDGHFDAIVEHFVATLKELGVKQDDIDDAVKVVETTREPIVHGY